MVSLRDGNTLRTGYGIFVHPGRAKKFRNPVELANYFFSLSSDSEWVSRSQRIMDIETNKETDRQRERQTDRQTDRKTDR